MRIARVPGLANPGPGDHHSCSQNNSRGQGTGERPAAPISCVRIKDDESVGCHRRGRALRRRVSNRRQTKTCANVDVCAQRPTAASPFPQKVKTRIWSRSPRTRCSHRREAGGHTRGPGCTPQRGSDRKAPDPPGGSSRVRPRSLRRAGDPACRWRAADTSRPRGSVMRSAVSSAYVELPTVENSPPIPVEHASLVLGRDGMHRPQPPIEK
jgi:hypothetical protein